MTIDTNLISDFATSLDNEDYQRTQSYLAEHCIYKSPSGDLIGPTAIVASYRENGKKAQSLFDSIVYWHEVISLGECWYQITFIDELTSGDRTHVFRCNQRIGVEAGLIAQIIHEEIPGQRDNLNAFLQSLD